MCPRADLRLYGRRLIPKDGFQSLIHHAQYRSHEIRVIAVDSEQGWRMQLQILHLGKRIARHAHPDQLYLDFSHARIAGLLHAYEIVDRRLARQGDGQRP
ncbi:hypothetical protein J8I26_08885 [Herbaspirillum sp. LeCh32-8]|uniref:hypothetical protein n=1 Tax=Herbaspirillum sp. LeCh32-8 TaxID=2821356 RepID=UPI001AE9C3BB|nr:hypothetical protein [Herbaspirillum sp. LeCh32-8]MBP0598215.1 hypothetical protein [Herbaspirillum sp. LeCh32-8]